MHWKPLWMNFTSNINTLVLKMSKRFIDTKLMNRSEPPITMYNIIQHVLPSDKKKSSNSPKEIKIQINLYCLTKKSINLCHKQQISRHFGCIIIKNIWCLFTHNFDHFSYSFKLNATQPWPHGAFGSHLNSFSSFCHLKSLSFLLHHVPNNNNNL